MTYDFTDVATLTTPRLRLEPLGPQHFDPTWAGLDDPEGRRLTGTHATFTQTQIRDWLASLPGRDDRADWAVVRTEDDRQLGEVVLNDLDADNASMGFRIALGGDVVGQGYGTEAARAVVAHGLEVIGLHRIELEVYAFNPRALRSYVKVGFVEEGRRRDALRWDGEWVDAITMAILATDSRSPEPG